MTAILNATGTTRTTTCGHNAQSNGEVESWWRLWNRAMKFLSPAEYLVWPSFAQRICFAYNAVPHDSLASVSPFEMDFGSSPISAFAPPNPDPADVMPDHLFDDSRQDLPPATHISPTSAAGANPATAGWFFL